MTADHDWDTWLRQWNRQLLSRYDPSTYDAFVDPLVTPLVVAGGWLGAPAAAEEQVAELETRLGARLPPSYRSFLLTANGFLQPGIIVPRLLAADEVSWLRDVDRQTIEAWTGAADAGGSVGPDAFERYLPSTLRVSARETVGTAMYLLNPEIITADGEWEAWFFAHWVPGVRRFPSFWALMHAEQEDFLGPPPPAPTRVATFLDSLRWIFRRPN
jgi:SMI1/KNR4 family protein SUKH-1